MEEQQRRPGSRWNQKRIIRLLVAVLLITAGLLLWINRPPRTFQYKGYVLEAADNVPVSRYDPEEFGLDHRGWMTYRHRGVPARLGIDVSYYQKNVDWQKVAGQGVEFAMIRLGYRGYESGLLNQDVLFEENLQGAREAGLEVGVYFFSQAVTPEEALEEAEFVLEVLDGRELDYPVVFDWETIPHSREPRTAGMSGEEITACAAAFTGKIQEAGYQPMLYFNPDMGYLGYDLGQLGHLPFWLARYDNHPEFYYDFDLWQFTHTARLEGVEGNVDLNLDLRPARDAE